MEAIETYTINVTRANGASYDIGEATDVGGCYVESKDLDLGDPYVYKLIRAAELLFSTPGQLENLHLIIKYRNNIKDDFQILDVSGKDIDKFIPLRVRNCKYFRIRLEDQGVTARWHLTEIRLYGSVAGKRL